MKFDLPYSVLGVWNCVVVQPQLPREIVSCKYIDIYLKLHLCSKLPCIRQYMQEPCSGLVENMFALCRNYLPTVLG